MNFRTLSFGERFAAGIRAFQGRWPLSTPIRQPRYAGNMEKLLTPMFKFYPQDYLMNTAALTLEEQAALMRLVAFCWTGSISKSALFDPAGMARLLGGISERKALRLAEKLHQFFSPAEEDSNRVVPNVPWIELTKTRPSMV